MAPDARPVGRWEPAELGVHPVAGGGPRGPMPAYIGRPHDELLRRMLDPGVPDSRLIVVRGEACAGKSRAAREAVAGRLADWPLEYPPTAAALAARLAAGIPARTVLWLGDLRRYADADDGAAPLNRLAELLHGDGPLVITTIWPEHWQAYVIAVGARRGSGDPARAAGRLIAGLDELVAFSEPDPAYGGIIDVPPRFTADELTAAAVRGDPVLAAAAAAAGPAGRVAQHLAGAPGLLRRYDGPDGNPHGQAIITAAMDAARLGCAAPLPAALVQDAAVGYLPAAPQDTSAEALAWASAEFDGAVRALEPAPAAADSGPSGYRIASYLDQHGRRTRGDRLVPASLWDALAGHAGAEAGAGPTAGDLTRDPASLDGIEYADSIAWLLAELRAAGAGEAIRTLLSRDSARHVDLYDLQSVGQLAAQLAAAGDSEAVRTLAARLADLGADLDGPEFLAERLAEFREAGAAEAIPILLARDPVARVRLDDSANVAWLLEELCAADAADAVRTLLDRDPAGQAALDHPRDIARLLRALRSADAGDPVTSLATRAAESTPPKTPRARPSYSRNCVPPAPATRSWRCSPATPRARYAAATDAASVELRDARLIIARELGFPTWRELVSGAEKSRRDLDERNEKWRRLRPQAEALLAGDAGRLAQLTAGQADTLLQMLAYPEAIPGVRLGEELGVPRAAVDVLIGKATSLDPLLTPAAISNRVEYVRLLLGAGADPGTRTGGTTPLENAIYRGNTQVVDLLARHGIVPRALWTYAACGRLDLVRGCFDADGRLRPGAAPSRPDPAGFFPIPPRIPATSDPEEIMAEAFVHACQHGRIEVVRWFLDRGLNPDAAPYLGRTGLHWAIMHSQLEVVRLLLQRGADPSIRDELLHADADGWLHIHFATRWHDPVTQQLHHLIESRSR